MTQVKEAKQGKHRSLTECLAQPGEFLLSDFSKIERPAVLHVAFQALEAFKAQHGRCPRPGNRDDCAAFGAAFQKINGGLVRPLSCRSAVAACRGKHRSAVR